ncbi:hypothetical protein EFP18_05195 [Burkholderia glumae]|nr:hypothetical protein GAS19_13395 [Burkholderia glumae]QHP92072.1 hypothetical protein EXE55_14620 [Burkholderia glumae]RQZ73817.1 hypothetical protein DF052_12040 [Burkholderia glumae]UVS83625.1 hypothetical protein EFP18_05195 [Burkholderia glumae]UVS89574.1 hypothetical protein EFP17_07045 [Burkholderia glumae]
MCVAFDSNHLCNLISYCDLDSNGLSSSALDQTTASMPGYMKPRAYRPGGAQDVPIPRFSGRARLAACTRRPIARGNSARHSG